MEGYSNRKAAFVKRLAGLTLLATVTLLNSQAFKIVDDTLGIEPFWCSGTGCVMGVPLTIGDDLVGTGTGLSQADADARYLNTAGDTGTGDLVINARLSSSGSTVHSSGSIAKPINFILTGSGAATATGHAIGIGEPEMPFTGCVRSVEAKLGETAIDLTTLKWFIGGTNVFSTDLTIDANEESSRTAAADSVFNTDNCFSTGDDYYFDVVAPAAGANLSVDAVLEFHNF